MNEVVHPHHYNAHPSGIECMDVVERLDFCAGNAIKYLWRADEKGQRTKDLEKAAFYLDRILQQGSTVVITTPRDDEILVRYGERLMQYGGWNAAPIWHIIQAATQHNKTHIAAARNHLYELINNPLEKRDGPRPRLQA